MNKIHFLIFTLLILSHCSKNTQEISRIKEINQNLEILSNYKEGYNAIQKGDYYFASKKFLEAELLFPQSEWAPKAALLASYAYYQQNYYSEAFLNLERIIKTYPKYKDLAYAHYLMAICYYETIEDEKRDVGPLLNAKKKFNFIIKNYPDTDFALDSKFKLDLIDNNLASKEMYLGRHYIKKEKYIAAINRFKTVIEKYDKTIFIEEALHRLVEINFKLGLNEESKKYANLLGYNYLSSEWYQKSYVIHNKNYSIEKSKFIKKDKNGIVSKFKKLFE